MNPKPNILLIMSDEHNVLINGCYGNSVIQTPNIDQIARNGVTFDACYCNSPLCVPSRLSFTSGKYVSRVGGWGNSSDLPGEDYPSIARVMNTAGYDSILCGKQHYAPGRHYGFAEITDGRQNSFLKTGKGQRRLPGDFSYKGLSERFDGFHPGEESEVLDHDRHVTDRAVDFFKKRSVKERPFFLFTGFLAPHFPLVVPHQLWQNYQDKIPMPVVPPGHVESLPLNYRMLRNQHKCERVPPELVRRGRELYYGLTEWMDVNIGKVLQALEASPFADNTIVIYTSDHGENMGEHGLWWKNNLFEHSARVPLIVSWPKRWKGGQRRHQVCSLVDVVQLIAELGGAETPMDWNGDPMAAWLDDNESPWKDSAICEYYGPNVASGCVMLRQGDWKYVYHCRPDADHAPEYQLYNLRDDPGEFANLSEDPRHQKRMRCMHSDLVEELGEDPELTEQRCRSDYAAGYG